MTDIDWDKAPEGAVSYAKIDSWGFFLGSKGYWCEKRLSDGLYCFGQETHDGENYNKEEFTIIELKPKPIYTDEMQKAGIPPVVGMECCYSSLVCVVWNECTIIA